MHIASVIFLILLGLLSLFQLALIFGAPWGKLAWGGQHKTLPLKLRIGSVFSLFLYALFAALVMSKLGVLPLVLDERILNTGLWVITIYLTLGIILNLASPSKPERYVMTPIATVLAGCAYIVMLG